MNDGFEVFETENGIKASFWLNENHADLIVLDVVMPEMDGIEFAYEMKRRFPKTPIVAISAGENIMSKELCLKLMQSLGAVETIPKPFDLTHFMTTVKRVLAASVSALN